ncbi:DUF995 domain-containing protein [Rhizobium sp. S95]|uniref:DUF995 domain-containing protein n=1 Tax=Ciceribacter sichuanensis TaxID=2949647 RepID=A0AAJ1BU91_9HYPH|nr:MULTISPECIES: DUF995 domain-containing protein [unclassified Ciceribacter]MCM2394809.1 DUF995 domain-containing protein [Ciceribacter sp. S95]MCO5955230.1 DUF995 domain-containing protein [Ciceribacter sp. S101]
MKKYLRNGGITCLALALFLPAAAFATSATSQKKVEPLSAAELTAIYSGKTWVWGTGGGRFDTKGRRFVAYTDEKGKASLGEGRWAVDNNGKLCIFAKWTASNGAGRAATCFGHVKVGDTIYQRRHPFGHWYVFRHASPRTSDEFRRLIAADTISRRAFDLKKNLAAN